MQGVDRSCCTHVRDCCVCQYMYMCLLVYNPREGVAKHPPPFAAAFWTSTDDGAEIFITCAGTAHEQCTHGQRAAQPAPTPIIPRHTNVGAATYLIFEPTSPLNTPRWLRAMTCGAFHHPLPPHPCAGWPQRQSKNSKTGIGLCVPWRCANNRLVPHARCCARRIHSVSKPGSSYLPSAGPAHWQRHVYLRRASPLQLQLSGWMAHRHRAHAAACHGPPRRAPRDRPVLRFLCGPAAVRLHLGADRKLSRKAVWPELVFRARCFV